MATFTLSQSAVINSAVINEYGQPLDFLSYSKGLWGVQNVDLSLIGQLFTYSETITGLNDSETQTEVESLLVLYHAKVLSAIETIVVNYNLGQYVDYKKARKALQDLVHPTLPAGWAAMTDNEKLICAKWFIVPDVMRSEVYTIEEQVENGEIFDKLSIQSRAQRFQAGKMLIYNMLAFNDARVIISEVSEEVTVLATNVINLDKLYINYGRESISLGDGVGLFDYVDNNMRSKPFTPIVGTMSDLSNAVLDILENGNY